MKTQYQLMLANKDALVPKKGFNLVGLDDYEEPGDQLFLIGHYDTLDKVKAAERDHNSRNKDVRTFIYFAKSEEAGMKKESVADSMARLLEEPSTGIDDWD